MSEHHQTLSRRSVIVAAGATVFSAAAPNLARAAGQQPRSPLPAELVKEFVIAGHSKLEQCRKMLEDQPLLLNATLDWGNGDFESAIGGAGHMGNREIALYLLSKGARMDMFVAAMLGELEIVQATLKAFPDLKDSKGPHGIPLLRHAQAGKATEVVKYLESLSA